jgi:hypothetical protein
LSRQSDGVKYINPQYKRPVLESFDSGLPDVVSTGDPMHRECMSQILRSWLITGFIASLNSCRRTP